MNKKFIIIAGVIWAVALCLAAFKSEAGELTNDAIVNGITSSSDSDGNTVTHNITGIESTAKNWMVGSYISRVRLSDRTESIKFNNVQFAFGRMFRNKLVLGGNISVLHLNDEDIIQPTVTLSGPISTKAYFEVSAGRSLVDSMLGIEHKIMVNSYNLSADYNFNNNVTIIGGISEQYFSDTNKRIIHVGRIIMPFFDIGGLSLQAKVKRTHSSFNPAEYYAPNRISEHLVGVLYKGLIFNKMFRIRSEIWYGTRNVSSEALADEFVGVVRVSKQVTKKTKIELEYSYLDIRGPYNYSWQQVRASVVVLFN